MREAPEHWLVLGQGDEDETFIVWDGLTAETHRQAGYRVDGPFLPIEGAVEAIDKAYAALNGSQYVGGPSERDAFRTAMEALWPYVTQHQGQERREAE